MVDLTVDRLGYLLVETKAYLMAASKVDSSVGQMVGYLVESLVVWKAE
jgi:hypothetical protein